MEHHQNVGENSGGDTTGKVQTGEIVATTVKDNYSDGENTATVPAGFVVSKIPEETTVEKEIGLINEETERNAVMKYNGFYIARYEAGQSGTTVISKQDATQYM